MSDLSPHTNRDFVQRTFARILRLQRAGWFTTGLLSGLVCSLLLVIIAALLDYHFVFSSSARWILFSGACAGGLAGLIISLVRQWPRQAAYHTIVISIEAKLTGARHGFATLLDHLNSTTNAEQPFLNALALKLQAMLKDTPIRRFVNLNPFIRRLLLLAAAAVLLAVPLFFLIQFSSAVWHVLLPAFHQPYTRIINHTSVASIPRGSNMVFSIALEGRQKPAAVIHLDFGGLAKAEMPIAVSNGTGSAVLRNVPRPFNYYISCGDDWTEHESVPVLNRPEIDQATAVITPPPYTRRAPFTLPADSIAALKGSTVSLSFSFREPATNVSVSTRPGGTLPIRPETGGLYRAQCVLTGNLAFIVNAADLTTPEGASAFQFNAELLQDKRPEAVMRTPAHDMKVKEDARLEILSDISDDIGLKNVSLVYQINDRPVQKIPLVRIAGMTNTVSAAYTFDVGQLFLQPKDFISLYIAAEDIGPETGREGYSDIRFIELIPPEYAGESQKGGSMTMFNPFGKFIRIQKAVLALSLQLVSRRDEPPASTLPVRTDLGSRETILGSTASTLYHILTNKAALTGMSPEQINSAKVINGLLMLSRMLGTNGTNYFDNKVMQAHTSSQRILLMMISLNQELPPNSSGEQNLAEEEKLLEALRLTEREMAKREEEERRRELAKLDDLEDDLNELQKMQREMKQEMQKNQDSPNDQDSKKASAKAQKGSQKGGQLSQKAKGSSPGSSQSFSSMQKHMDQVRDKLNEGNQKEAMQALDQAMKDAAKAERDLLGQQQELLNEAFESLAQQAGLLAEYQAAIRSATADSSNAIPEKIVRDQQQAAQWWDELRTAIGRFAEAAPPDSPQGRAGDELARAAAAKPLADTLGKAAAAAREGKREEALGHQQKAEKDLTDIANLADALKRRLTQGTLEWLLQAAEEAEALAEIQEALAQDIPAEAAELSPQRKDFMAGKQQQLLNQIQSLAARAEQGDSEGYMPSLLAAGSKASTALGILEGTMMEPLKARSAAQNAADELREGARKLRAAVQFSAVERLAAVRDSARELAQNTNRSPAAVKSLDTEFTTLASVFHDSDVTVRLCLASTRWARRSAPVAPGSLLMLAADCDRAIGVLEQPKLTRVETFLSVALRQHQNSTNPVLTVAAAEAAVDTALDHPAHKELLRLLAVPESLSNETERESMTKNIRTLQPSAHSWVNMLIRKRRNVLPIEERCPEKYVEEVNEYFRTLSYK